MQIQFKGTNYTLDSDITDFAERKLHALKKFLGKPEKPTLTYVDLGKATEAHKTGAVWYADINMEIDGEPFNAKAQADTLRSAIEKMTKELEQELRTTKKKRERLERKGAGRVKEFFRFGR